MDDSLDMFSMRFMVISLDEQNSFRAFPRTVSSLYSDVEGVIDGMALKVPEFSVLSAEG